MREPSSVQVDREVAVGLFERTEDAQAAERALVSERGITPAQIVVLPPGSSAEARELLVQAGVPEGEARYYTHAVSAGSTLLVVPVVGSAYDVIRQVMLRHNGSDVQSQGRELVRGEVSSAADGGSGVRGGTGSRPIDLTARWEDVASRYRMLWQQHYGTSDTTWETIEPVYEFAWQAANRPEYRGRPWAEIEGAVRCEWEASAGRWAWADVVGPIRDVWEDVARDAVTAEGGRERNISGPGTEQSVAARDVQSPSA